MSGNSTLKVFPTPLLAILLCIAFGLFDAKGAQIPNREIATSTPISTVPFLGCKSDGQVGPLPPPGRPDRIIEIDPQATQQLTYYKAEYGEGVLGPRGWSCFGFYGSSGAILLITPDPTIIDLSFKSTSGSAIQMTERSGDTSGRFEVAKIAARVFPAQKSFVDQVIREGIMSASDFPIGPYPADRMVYRSARMVEYETPPQSEGLGTQSRLEKNGDSIRGVAILHGDTPDLLQLAVRLPSNMDNIASRIIQQFEQGN
jgi:hypothetical protein